MFISFFTGKVMLFYGISLIMKEKSNASALGRATIASGPCDERTPSRVRHQTVASCRSISFLRFPLAAPPCFFYFHPAEKANADDNLKGNGSFNTIFTPFPLTIGK